MPQFGRRKTLQHYTNIHRIECLARSHPLVLKVEYHNPHKAADPSTFDQWGRAVKFHQSPHDLRLAVGSRVEMLVGCSVQGAAQGLLSLWWCAAAGYQLTKEQESLAQAVFFDLVEAAHNLSLIHI